MCCSRWLNSGGFNMSWCPCPFASQLAFVWHISAWLTPELSVWDGCLCPDLVTRLEDGGDKGEEFWWHHLLLRQFISTLPAGFRLFHHTYTHKDTEDTNKWTNTSGVGFLEPSSHYKTPPHFYQLKLCRLIVILWLLLLLLCDRPKPPAKYDILDYLYFDLTKLWTLPQSVMVWGRTKYNLKSRNVS